MPSPHEPVFSPGAAGGRHAKAAGVSEPEPCGREPPLFTHPGQAGKDKQRKRQRSGGGDRARGGLSPAPSARHRAAAAAPAQEHPGAARVASSRECPRRAPPLPRLPIPGSLLGSAFPARLSCLQTCARLPTCKTNEPKLQPRWIALFPSPFPATLPVARGTQPCVSQRRSSGEPERSPLQIRKPASLARESSLGTHSVFTKEPGLTRPRREGPLPAPRLPAGAGAAAASTSRPARRTAAPGSRPDAAASKRLPRLRLQSCSSEAAAPRCSAPTDGGCVPPPARAEPAPGRSPDFAEGSAEFNQLYRIASG